MRNAILIGALLVAAGQGGADAAAYGNRRFGFSIDYPADKLIAEPEAPNGDGQVFHAKTAGVRFSVYASHRMDNETPHSIATSAEQDCGSDTPADQIARADFVAMSCSHKATIVYQRTIIRGDTLTTLTASYPAADRALWNKVVAAMAASLRPATR